jgi:hypothetical protein
VFILFLSLCGFWNTCIMLSTVIIDIYCACKMIMSCHLYRFLMWYTGFQCRKWKFTIVDLILPLSFFYRDILYIWYSESFIFLSRVYLSVIECLIVYFMQSAICLLMLTFDQTLLNWDYVDQICPIVIICAAIFVDLNPWVKHISIPGPIMFCTFILILDKLLYIFKWPKK